MLEITKANITEISDVITHYKTVIEQIKDYDFTPGWEFGIHPTEEHIKKAIESGELYIVRIDSEIAGSLIIDNNSLEANDKIDWTYDLTDEETYFIHLVAVNQDYRNRGIAKRMLSYADELAKRNSIKSIRLCLNKTNSNIEGLYLKAGFEYMGTVDVYIQKRGNITFKLYEKIV
ncbi:MAG: hypothetical protein BZ138_01905 [Methanosphaera sp. rholeuAM270]|nr:MAG: hypothetical protein BZ138_01905 [Methanosphaera sp. rholeuAM270]